MNKKLYYEVDFCRCKTSTEKTMNRKFAEDGDCIEWYNDGENIFFGDCACDEKQVAEWIKNKVTFKSNITDKVMGGFMNVITDEEQITYNPINEFTTVDLGTEQGNYAYKKYLWWDILRQKK